MLNQQSIDVKIDEGRIDGRAIESLLYRVFVEGGFTDPALAKQMFAADSVRARGILLTAIDAAGLLVGTIIVVPPGAPAVRLAGPHESEMHLLAVSPDHRNAGIGDRLVKAALAQARSLSHGMVLWTQPTMHDAQRLYVKAGFHRDPARDFERAGRNFLVYTVFF